MSLRFKYSWYTFLYAFIYENNYYNSCIIITKEEMQYFVLYVIFKYNVELSSQNFISILNK